MATMRCGCEEAADKLVSLEQLGRVIEALKGKIAALGGGCDCEAMSEEDIDGLLEGWTGGGTSGCACGCGEMSEEDIDAALDGVTVGTCGCQCEAMTEDEIDTILKEI